MASSTVENYLKALFSLSNEHDEVNISELSAHLGVSKPSVNSMVKTLSQKSWVRYQKYKPLVLTAEGKKAAALIIRKHRLTEMYLVEKMDFGWEEVHEIAEEIEHIKAPAFFDRMDSIMGFPKFDPHGSPIPDKNGDIISNDYIRLSECDNGQQVILKALAQSSKEFLDFLTRNDIALNTEIEILAVEPYDQSMKVRCNQKQELTLSLMVCEKLLVGRVSGK